MQRLPAQLLEADPDVGLDVLDQMADVDVAVGVGQGAGDENSTVTAALPYANGHIHIGHLVEYIQTDIWVRFQKLRGHRCIYICADDTHGTAIMIRARQEGRSEEELIADMQQAHVADFAGFDIEFDNYGSTNSEENRAVCAARSGRRCGKAGLVHEQEVTQLYDPEAGRFWPTGSSKGHVRIADCARPVRRQLRQVRRARTARAN